MRILVVDDHEVVRRGICSVLATEPALTLCGEAVDGRDAVEKATTLRPDVVVMDISMPQMNGLDATREIKRLLPDTEIVIVSQHEAPEMVRQAFQAGARGYVVKSTVAKDLLSAIAKINGGELFVKGVETANTNPALDSAEVLQRSAAFETALRESEERFRSAMNNMAEGLVMLDARGRITYLNPSAEALFGWNVAELLGKDIHETTHYKRQDGTSFPAADCPLLQVLRSGIALREHEDVFVRKDGSFLPVVFSASPLKIDGSVAGAVVGFRDDAKRRDTQEALRQSERIYRAIGESIDYGVWICDPDGRNIYASPSFLKLLGLTQEQCSEFGWVDVLHPEDVESTITSWQTCVREGTFWEREHRFRTAEGNWHHILARGVPIRDKEGEILYWAGINLDIQHRKESERQLQQLVQTLESRVSERTLELEKATGKLRELTGTLLQTQDEERRRIARELHDGVGQLVVAMSMNLTNIVSEKKNLSAEAQRTLDQNLALIEQASREIRTMSHLLHPPLLDEVGLDSALRWYVDGFSERSKITVHTQLAPGFTEQLPRELALSIFRIVQESLTNIHRHSESLTAVVKIDRSAKEIVLVVEDEGKGIAVEIQAKISSGEIAGVGLRGMRERIRQFGGSLEVRSNQDGTRIIAILPLPKVAERDEKTTADLEPTEPAKTVGRGKETDANEIDLNDKDREPATILCIDDELTGLLARKLLLESAGHRVIEARSGLEGIRLFKSEKVDAVILDYWMSGMKGTAVASELKRINPAIPIIVLSGVSDLPGEAAGLVDLWLLKGSHRAEQLLDSIGTLLERRPA
jgi:PAS domain S-box-containing protein